MSCWISPGDHHKASVLARKGLRLIKSVKANRYHFVAIEIVGTPYVLNIVDVETKIDIMVGNPPDWVILPVGLEERVCNTFGVCLVPLYECLFTLLGI